MSASFQKPIRFASINIEHNAHYDQVIPFLKNFQPDVICLQELLECDIALFERELGMKCVFAPMALTPKVKDDISAPMARSGIGILTASTILASNAHYYVGSQDDIPVFYKDPKTGIITVNKVLLSVAISHNGMPYTFANTHFTWTEGGHTTDEQRAHLKKLFAILDTMPEFVLSGDFNAPRGREIFSTLAARYKDNIPAHYKTSIDKNLHRAGDLQLMVDGLFSTPQYEITDVKLTDGVSDHMAVTALISKEI
ncbi:MAG: hypothetical protein Q7R65_02105 [bacterium]|nr:hypothetical protein [bacterium]